MLQLSVRETHRDLSSNVRCAFQRDVPAQLLHGVFQLPMVASVFLVQVFTDYADKFLILVIVTLIIQRIPTRIKEKV